VKKEQELPEYAKQKGATGASEGVKRGDGREGYVQTARIGELGGEQYAAESRARRARSTARQQLQSKIPAHRLMRCRIHWPGAGAPRTRGARSDRNPSL
jgi:hypothetical protein